MIFFTLEHIKNLILSHSALHLWHDTCCDWPDLRRTQGDKHSHKYLIQETNMFQRSSWGLSRLVLFSILFSICFKYDLSMLYHACRSCERRATSAKKKARHYWWANQRQGQCYWGYTNKEAHDKLALNEPWQCAENSTEDRNRPSL